MGRLPPPPSFPRLPPSLPPFLSPLPSPFLPFSSPLPPPISRAINSSSTQPPEREPAVSPAALQANREPAGRGDEP